MLASLEAERTADETFAAFHALVLADTALRNALADLEDTDAFVARAVQAGQARGLGLNAEALNVRLHVPPPPPVLEGLSPAPGWLPAEVTRIDGRDDVSWIWLGRRRLTESFYGDSLTLARHRPFNRLLGFRTPLAELETWAAALSAPDPDGLIFHMSRCGSTLAAQMLAAPAGHVVISEAAPLNAIVQARDLDETTKVALLRAMAGVLGQARNPGEARLFLKLDSWHALDLPLFRRAFPRTPWVFLYRDPVEVMVSHVRRRGIQMVPSLVPPATFGIDLPSGVPDEDYCARVLAAVCEGALRHYPDGGGRLVDYRDMPEALFTDILQHFGVAVSDRDVMAMRAATARDAKASEQGFTPDGQGKQLAATPAVRAICQRRLGDAHRRLEALRAGER
jgi:hypothetical protein